MKDAFTQHVEQKVQRKLRERDIQKSCVDWARSKGWWARKFSSPSQRSVPDYLFAHKDHGSFACEFKAPGKASTKAQIDEQKKMLDAGWTVTEKDNAQAFQDFVHLLEWA